MSEQLVDEVLSINAIYDDGTLRSADDNAFVLTLPSSREIGIRLTFPEAYPDASPLILGTESSGPTVAKGEGQQLVELLRSVLAETFVPGTPCIFDLVEETIARLQQFSSPVTQDQQTRSRRAQADGLNDSASTTAFDHVTQPLEESVQPPVWAVSDVVTEKKSTFVARAAHVGSVQQAKQFVRHLLSTDKKVARATHNITAWRIKGANDVQYQDCDDDGETAAGGRLLHLLELMDVWDTMVIVTRWYGGVHLGSDRFRIINQVARDAVVKIPLTVDTAARKASKR